MSSVFRPDDLRLGPDGIPQTLLPPEPADAQRAIDAALAGPPDSRDAALRQVAARWPTCLEAWARLGELALERGDPVEAYAYFRVGYHRSLDRLRQNGWRGQGRVPAAHSPNRGFLLSLRGLMQAAEAIGEVDEQQRCRQFLRECDPTF